MNRSLANSAASWPCGLSTIPDDPVSRAGGTLSADQSVRVFEYHIFQSTKCKHLRCIRQTPSAICEGNGTIGRARTADLRIHNPAL